MIKNFFKTGWRNLLRNKGYTSINILGLALGISVCLVIFLLTSYELSYDRFHPGRERIYRVVGAVKFKEEPIRKLGYVPSPLPMRVREQITGLEQATGFYNYYAKVTIPQAAGKEAKEFAPPVSEQASPVIVAETPYFSIFQYQWLAGNPATALQEPFKVVLTVSAAAKYFEGQSADQLIGREVIYNDSLKLTVSGIVKDWEHNSDFGFTDFISFPTVQQSFLKNNIEMDSWGMWDYYSQAYIKIAGNATPAQVEAQFPRFVKDNLRGEGNSLQLQPLSDIHFNEDYKDGYARKVHLPTLYGLMGIAAFILLIAIINFINLSIAQSIKRAKEIGVRKVLGSSLGRLRAQFFSETFLVTLTAVAIAAILLKPVLGLFSAFIPAGLVQQPFPAYVWLFLPGVLLLVTLLAGFYPAKVLSSYQPVLSLKGQAATPGSHRNYLRKSLIVFQFTISLVFIIGTIVVGKQINYMLTTDMGFDKDAIINLNIGSEKTPANKILFAQKLQQLSGVTAVSLHGNAPAAQRHPGTSIKSIGTSGTDAEIISSFEFVDNQYIPLYNIKMLAGRNLLPSDTLREFVLNETSTRALGFKKPQDAIGQLVQVGISGKIGPVAGVMEDFHSKSFREAITPFFITTTARSARTISVKLATDGKQISHLKTSLASIQKIWKGIYPDKKFDMRFLDETIAAFYEKEEKTAQLMNTAMVVAIFISCMGLFGLAAFMAQQRTKEIGVRKVLGATAVDIASMLSKDFLKLVLIAVVIASPIAWYLMNGWLEDFAYRTTINWWIFILAGLAAIVITLCTISFQSIKAALVNPVKSLRSE
jgi:putative ABC transport system permease protein